MVDAAFIAGVTQQPIWDYCRTRAFTVRRLDPAVPTALAMDVAVRAQLHRGEPYSTLQAMAAAIGLNSAMAPNPQALFCSTFAGLVIAEATALRLWNDPAHQPLLPGLIATHPDLQPVPLEWRLR
jgi:hypothetical protein